MFFYMMPAASHVYRKMEAFQYTTPAGVECVFVGAMFLYTFDGAAIIRAKISEYSK